MAQKAKDAAEQFENQINDSIGVITNEEEEKESKTELSTTVTSEPDHKEETDGYLNVEEECVSFSERVEEINHENNHEHEHEDDVGKQLNNNNENDDVRRQRVESAPSTGEFSSGGISFVDLSDELPVPNEEHLVAADVSEEASRKIALLEQMVKSLEEQLMSAKEESDRYYASNLGLMEQVRELEEENKLLRSEK